MKLSFKQFLEDVDVEDGLKEGDRVVVRGENGKILRIQGSDIMVRFENHSQWVDRSGVKLRKAGEPTKKMNYKATDVEYRPK